MKPRKKKKDLLIEYKERAFKMIKERVKNFAIVYEDDHCFVIAYKKNLNIIIKNENNIFQPSERNENRDFCVLKLIAFYDVPISDNMNEWFKLGAEHDYITQDARYIENVT
jgi:hypothetical protein